ncbi:NAD(P)/FAD-dependent oxidoreductase [Amantichitinum ursilacus]|uniref:Rubredoxin-NAD(+) reductase n=1 Tax=Amantichitinum ursilacus TaxID=857265 RepID=A0A0N1JSM7_9NEIS|nr:FAD-dependent oxidoreductase [Amantichitinum ursilacus]KPC52659.1 Rubredoxin-NAD(+) reductase [Amantichitinum ursilacus]
MASPVVIIGAGLAGYNLAREFRKLDPTFPLVIIANDKAGFYSKPMLSNALAGKKTAETLVMKSAEKMAEELNAIIRADTEVVGVDLASKLLLLSDGQAQPYRDLVLAVGAQPVRLRLGGDAADEVLSVNHIEDFAVFAQSLEGAKRIAVIGGGLIGCEFANDLLAREIAPVVVEAGAWPLPGLLPDVAGAWFAARLTQSGVRFVLNTTAKAVDKAGAGYKVTLSTGEVLEVDCVLSAVGLHPNTALAEAAGLHVNKGVAVDRQLRTSNPNVFALGDCAEVETIHLPYVMPLMHAARTLAQVLAGKDDVALAYPAMPVLVKTPSCATIVAPPAHGALGEWQVQTAEDAMEAHFVGADGQLLGFALLGAATKQRQILSAKLPPVLA